MKYSKIWKTKCVGYPHANQNFQLLDGGQALMDAGVPAYKQTYISQGWKLNQKGIAGFKN